MDNGYRTYSAYSFDISTGKLLTGTELLSRYNYSESNAVVSAQNDIIKRYSGQVGVTDDAVIQRQRQKALDQNKNISNMQFYIDNNKKVNIIYYAAWVAGAEGYYYSIPITKDEPINISTDLIPDNEKNAFLFRTWHTLSYVQYYRFSKQKSEDIYGEIEHGWYDGSSSVWAYKLLDDGTIVRPVTLTYADGTIEHTDKVDAKRISVDKMLSLSEYESRDYYAYNNDVLYYKTNLTPYYR